MTRKKTFEKFYALNQCEEQAVFSLKKREEADAHDTCVFYHQFAVYGIPKKMTFEEENRMYMGNTERLTKIADVRGTVILCKELIRRGEDPWLICDDQDGNLSYAMTVLTAPEGPLNEEDGDPYQDVYYLDEITMVEDFREDRVIRERILQELPNLIFRFLHVAPELFVHYPYPNQIEAEKDERLEILENLNNQRLRAAIDQLFDFGGEKEKSNIVSYGEKYQFSEEELALLYPDDSTPPYPEEAKNKEEFELFESIGYLELGDSRLLCMEVDQI